MYERIQIFCWAFISHNIDRVERKGFVNSQEGEMYAFLLATALVACPHGCNCQPPNASRELVFNKPAVQILVELLENEPDMLKNVDVGQVFDNAKLSVSDDFSTAAVSTTARRRFATRVYGQCLRFTSNEQIVLEIPLKMIVDRLLGEEGRAWAARIDRVIPDAMAKDFAKQLQDVELKKLVEELNLKRQGELDSEELLNLVLKTGLLEYVAHKQVAESLSNMKLDYNLRVRGSYVSVMAVHIRVLAEAEKTRVRISVWCRLRGFVVRQYSQTVANTILSEADRITRYVVLNGKIPSEAKKWQNMANQMETR
jgi:hypothetical protein